VRGKRLDGRRAGTDGGHDRQMERLRVLCRRPWRDRGAVLGRPVVDAALQDVQLADLPTRLQATLTFLEVLPRTPNTLTARDARTVLREGITPQALEDAIAVAALFNVIGRCADALDYDVPGGHGP
jgi:alkylhydroperoxidase family enzyme